MDRSIGDDTYSISTRNRIESMYRGDRWFSIAGLFALWAVTGFVCVVVNQLVTSPPLSFALISGALLVLIFNTASVVAMLKHYEEDKDHIYGLDIRHLDENRALKVVAASRLAAEQARM